MAQWLVRCSLSTPDTWVNARVHAPQYDVSLPSGVLIFGEFRVGERPRPVVVLAPGQWKFFIPWDKDMHSDVVLGPLKEVGE